MQECLFSEPPGLEREPSWKPHQEVMPTPHSPTLLPPTLLSFPGEPAWYHFLLWLSPTPVTFYAGGRTGRGREISPSRYFVHWHLDFQRVEDLWGRSYFLWQEVSNWLLHGKCFKSHLCLVTSECQRSQEVAKKSYYTFLPAHSSLSPQHISDMKKECL